jgi:iron-sulfur cluster assembly accessory protein
MLDTAADLDTTRLPAPPAPAADEGPGFSPDDTIRVTELAAENIVELRDEYGGPGWGLRYGITGGGCSGYKYVLEFEESPSGDDLVFEHGEVRVFVDRAHMPKLKNSVIDWKDNLMEAGFDIQNPQARRPCGCGESVDF